MTTNPIHPPKIFTTKNAVIISSLTLTFIYFFLLGKIDIITPTHIFPGLTIGVIFCIFIEHANYKFGKLKGFLWPRDQSERKIWDKYMSALFRRTYTTKVAVFSTIFPIILVSMLSILGEKAMINLVFFTSTIFITILLRISLLDPLFRKKFNSQ